MISDKRMWSSWTRSGKAIALFQQAGRLHSNFCASMQTFAAEDKQSIQDVIRTLFSRCGSSSESGGSPEAACDGQVLGFVQLKGGTSGARTWRWRRARAASGESAGVAARRQRRWQQGRGGAADQGQAARAGAPSCSARHPTLIGVVYQARGKSSEGMTRHEEARVKHEGVRSCTKRRTKRQ
eukprot:3286165-Rhodomonas_salina.1